MKRGVAAGFILGCGLCLSAAVLRAEVKTEEKNQLKMEGIMGRMMGMFGGKAAKEGAISTVAVKGNRKLTTTDMAGEIVDLGEARIYELDLKKKNYKVVTFEEMRRRLQEAREEAAKAVKENSREQSPQRQMEMDFSVNETGQKRSISGYDCREMVMTITMREKGKTLEDAGGLVITSRMWLAPTIPATKEIFDFEMRYAQAMGLTFGPGGSAEQMAAAMAMYPGMQDMLKKMEAESGKMDGTAILTEMTMESVISQAQMSQQKQESDSSGGASIGGIGGMLGRRLSRKKEPDPDPDKPKNRSTIMTVTNELLKVETSVADSDVAIPAGFKEKK